MSALRTLDTLSIGDRARVKSIAGLGPVQQRLLEMGVSRGAEVEVLRFAPLGDPMEIYVRGFHLTLRKGEAAIVEVDEAVAP